MNYHPKEILATCVYLASKVEEFNVSIQQFVANVKGDRNKAQEIILSNELLLMQELNYNLTVHNPVSSTKLFLGTFLNLICAISIHILVSSCGRFPH